MDNTKLVAGRLTDKCPKIDSLTDRLPNRETIFFGTQNFRYPIDITSFYNASLVSWSMNCNGVVLLSLVSSQDSSFTHHLHLIYMSAIFYSLELSVPCIYIKLEK